MTLNKHTVIYGCTRMPVNAEQQIRQRSLDSSSQRIGIHLWPNGRCCPFRTTIDDDFFAFVGTIGSVCCIVHRIDQIPTNRKPGQS